ncbi:MAG: HAD family phosphatase [Treponema sp.]|uniref:HAD family hydrolase n=1 Tax=Treponema sp. TaxID=166 RepID=UPI001D93B1C8|nr:HAD family phosphatase [Treponema sp.]MBS7241454.1 HAD family phosphatase [Treponema sp.]
MKGAIFDVDGTILDTMPMWATLAQDYLKTKGVNASNEINIRMLSFTVPQAAVYMKEQYGLEITPEQIECEIQKMAEDFYRFTAPLKEGILDAIQFLHEGKTPMIVASSGIKELIEAAFARLGIEKYFSAIFTGDKNNPELFNQCLSFLNTPAEEVLVFEDGIHAIKTAKGIGMKTVLIKDIQLNYGEIKELSDYTLEDEKWKQF